MTRSIVKVGSSNQGGILSANAQGMAGSRPSGAKTLRLWLICMAVGLLAVLPVLPLQFNGLSMPVWTGPTFTDLMHLFNGSGERVKQAHKAPPPPPTPAAKPIEQVQLFEQAAQNLILQISQSPADPALQNRIGVVYLGLGELDKARIHFERAVDLAHIGLAGISDRQQVMQHQGRAGEATSLLIEASRLNVELSAGHSNLARVYERLGQHARVLAELDLLNREGVFPDNGLPAGAGIASATTVSGIHRLTPIVTRLLANAEALVRSQKFNEAMQEFKNVIALCPDVAVAHRDLGVLNAMSNNGQGAVDELETAVRLDPNDAVSQNDLGLAYQGLNKLREAKEHFEHAIASNPRIVDAAINLGNLYAAKESYANASQVLRQAVETNPQSAVAHNNLGTVLSLQGNSYEAVEEFRKALALQPDLVSAHYGLGLALLKSKNYRQAISEFKQALLLNPKLVDAHEKIEQATRKANSLEASG
jgi:tetratricopeptide (TPR) repeat protein